MKIALAQTNPLIGDIPGNVARMEQCLDRAAAAGAELVVFPELSVCGYPPRDLLLKPQFIEDNARAVRTLAGRCTRLAALVGFVRANPSPDGRRLHNAAALLAGGRHVGTHVKTLLPTYDVFDESRYFEPGPPPAPLEWSGRRIGVTVCEDLWDPDALGRQLYRQDPVAALGEQGAQLLVNLSASPYQLGKHAARRSLLSRQAQRLARPIVYVNQVGGNDELVFDGASCVVSAEGRVIAQARDFQEQLVVVDLAAPGGETVPGDAPREGMASLKAALELGLRDYIRKCGFEKVVLGLSGGIDSAVVAVLAADALGPRNVTGVALPSRYSSAHSIADAEQLAANLGIRFLSIPIEPMHAAFEGALAGIFANLPPNIAEENLQARARGTVLMALSNKFGWMVLATGNKSELSVGYCTLYGDMCGGLAPIGDVPKTMVYQLARHVNDAAGRERIPESSITKPPSAELKPDQTDQDTLPPYDVLDAILERYIEQEQSVGQIAEQGYPLDLVKRVARMVDNAEYKRRQAAPVLKVTSRAFGVGRRIPIAQRFRYAGGI